MRFISHINRFGVKIFDRKVEILGGGVERELRPQLVANFQMGDVTPDEVRFAEQTFNLNGRTTEIDTVTPTNILSRLSTYDTENEGNLETYHQIDLQMEGQPTPNGRGVWGEGTTKQLVEEALIRRGDGQMFAPIVEARLTPPWPRYDDFRGSIEELVTKVEDDGHHLPAVIAYEKQNLHRPDVLAALQEKLEEIEAEVAATPASEFVT
jgi:hypothetical protein